MNTSDQLKIVATLGLSTLLAACNPFAFDQNVAVNEDDIVEIKLNAFDLERDALTYTVVSQPIHGELVGQNQVYTYKPNLNFFGTDEFTFVANDGSGNSNEAIVSIEIVSTNDKPKAKLAWDSKSAATSEKVLLDASLSTDIDGDPLEYQWKLFSKPEQSAIDLEQQQGINNSITPDVNGEYRFELIVKDPESSSIPFQARVVVGDIEEETVKFVAIGDMGTGEHKQFLVAEAIAEICALKGCDFILGLGDNIYESGPNDEYDEQFQTKFEDPYAAIDLPFYMVLGNHDTTLVFPGDGLGNPRGEFEVAYAARTDRITEKWQMPDRFYRFSAPINGEFSDEVRPLIDFYALDSNPLTNLVHLHGDYLLGPYSREQSAWMQEQIESSQSKWKMAFAHHPYLSNGKHGNAGSYDGLGKIPTIGGFFYKNFLEENMCDNMDLYLSGHDHDLQWLHATEACGKTEFIVSGAAAKTRSFADPERNEAFYQLDDTLGFFWIEVSWSELSATVYQVDKESGESRILYERTKSQL